MGWFDVLRAGYGCSVEGLQVVGDRAFVSALVDWPDDVAAGQLASWRAEIDGIAATVLIEEF